MASVSGQSPSADALGMNGHPDMLLSTPSLKSAMRSFAEIKNLPARGLENEVQSFELPVTAVENTNRHSKPGIVSN
eukprot:1806111-Amphidinium_carterae.1